MKKTAILLLLATLVSTPLAIFTSCTSQEGAKATTTTTVTTTTKDPGTMNTPSKVQHNIKLNKDLTTMKTVVNASTPKTEEYQGYSMVTSGAEWQIPANVDYSLYEFVGSGSDLLDYLSNEENSRYYSHFKKGNIVYYRVNYAIEDDPIKKTNRNTVAAVKALGAKIQYNASMGKLLVYYQPLELKMSSDYSSVTGKSGAMAKISFHTSIPVTYLVSVSRQKNFTEEGNIIYHKNLIPTKAADGSYVGVAKFTIPYTEPGEYYINFISSGKCLQSIPFTVEAGEDPYNDKYHLMFAGDWDLITDPNYQQNMSDLFYSVYPRLLARWGTGVEPTNIVFHADVTYDGVAYAVDNTVTVATDYASENPHDLGFFSHELTHNAQQYNFYYGDEAWWTENFATYGGFRYFHWTNPNHIQLYNKNDETIYFWPSDSGNSYGPYGNGCKWFFAYMDYHWPTTQDENGNRINGLIDTINFEIKDGRLTGGSDNPYNKNNTFNKIVKEVTGYDCMEDIRAQYEADFKSGAWDFKGFADYEGNFLTENLPFVENPVYPMLTEKNPGDKTAAKLETPVTSGENLALGATVPQVSGAVNSKELGEFLVDGDLTTKWCCTSGSASDKTYSLDGTLQWIVLDLGEEKTFNTYTLYNTKTQETGGNTTEWELLVSNDAQNWVSVDYQPNCNDNIASFNIGQQTARYLLFKGYVVDYGDGTIRLYEFQLYNQ